MIVFSKNNSPRLQYIINTLFGDKVVITNDIEKFKISSLKKINYSQHKLGSEDIWIKPCNFLFENNIKQQNISVSYWDDLPVFFETISDIPFDLLSASFYLITRYEEYFDDFEKDLYNNYHHKNSLAFKANFLHLPLVNLWLKKIDKQFQLNISLGSFNFTPTFDVDIAFAYKHHSFLKNFAGFFLDIQQKRNMFFDRLKTLLNVKKDTYDNFDFLKDLHSRFKIKTIYFFLVAHQRSLLDKNAKYNSKGMIDLINKTSNSTQIGIHPSFLSNKNKDLLKKEIEYLKKTSNQKITKSRQHYLQLKFPETYENLIENGIEEDYTLGYGTNNGFRASYTNSFFWYNLKKETSTNLLLHPFCYMDSNSIFEQKLSNTEAFQEMISYYNTVKSVNGSFIFILHNHFMANNENGKKWKDVYVNFLEEISKLTSS